MNDFAKIYFAFFLSSPILTFIKSAQKSQGGECEASVILSILNDSHITLLAT